MPEYVLHQYYLAADTTPIRAGRSKLAAGLRHSSIGKVLFWAWGDNTRSQLGLGSGGPSSQPLAVESPLNPM